MSMYDSPSTQHKFSPLVTHTLYITDTGTIQTVYCNNSFLLYLFKTLLVIIHVLLRLIITLPFFLSFSKNKWYALHNSKCTNILSIWLLERLSEEGENVEVQLTGFHTRRLACEMQQRAHECISRKVWQRLFWINSNHSSSQREVDSFISYPTCLLI